MRSTMLFVGLVGFALVNTAFLGLYLSSDLATSSAVATTSGTLTGTTSLQYQLTSATSTSGNLGPATTSSTGSPSSTETQTQTGVSTSSPVASTGTETSLTVTASTTTTTTTVYSMSSTVSSVAQTTSESASSSANAQSASSSTYLPSTTTGTSTVTQTSTSAPLTSTSSSLGVANSQVNQLSSSSTATTTSSVSGIPSGASATATPAVPLAVLTAKFFEDHSLELAPASWFAVGGMWIWRGRMRSKWTELGFDSDVFSLFVKMKGAKTRIRLLESLSVPKDRLQLAEELGLDWKSVDRHVAVMKKYGFVEDKLVYGRVRMYQLTPMGVSLMKLLEELSREERRENLSPPVPLREQA